MHFGPQNDENRPDQPIDLKPSPGLCLVVAIHGPGLGLASSIGLACENCQKKINQFERVLHKM